MNEDEKRKAAQSAVEKCKFYEYEGVKYPILKDEKHCIVTSVDLGDFVTIRSVHDGEKDDVYLGIYVGKVRTSISYNPAFYVPGLKKILCGFESWWSKIPDNDLNLTCEKMKEKHVFSWEDIEKQCEFYAHLINTVTVGVNLDGEEEEK